MVELSTSVMNWYDQLNKYSKPESTAGTTTKVMSCLHNGIRWGTKAGTSFGPHNQKYEGDDMLLYFSHFFLESVTGTSDSKAKVKLSLDYLTETLAGDCPRHRLKELPDRWQTLEDFAKASDPQFMSAKEKETVPSAMKGTLEYLHPIFFDDKATKFTYVECPVGDNVSTDMTSRLKDQTQKNKEAVQAILDRRSREGYNISHPSAVPAQEGFAREASGGSSVSSGQSYESV